MDASPRGGAPWDERLEPGALFDLMDPLIGPDGVRMINHPWDEPLFGRDLGYLRAIGFDPRQPLPRVADASPEGTLLARPGGLGSLSAVHHLRGSVPGLVLEVGRAA